MNGWQDIFVQYPLLGAIWDALKIVLPLSALLAFSGLLFISVAAKITALTGKRSAYDKCARQLALLALILGWALLIGGRVWLYYTEPAADAKDMGEFMTELSWLLLSLSALLTSVYYTLWRILKNMPVLHVTIGVIGATQNCLALLSIVATISLYAHIDLPIPAVMKLPEIFPSEWDARIWTCACYLAPLLFALAAGYGCVWLFLRRKSDDFGRDYYNRLIPWLAAWAKNAWLALWLMLLAAQGLSIWNSFQASGSISPANYIECAALFYWLLPLIIWTFIRKTNYPLRHVWAIWLGALIMTSFAWPWYLSVKII